MWYNDTVYTSLQNKVKLLENENQNINSDSQILLSSNTINKLLMKMKGTQVSFTDDNNKQVRLRVGKLTFYANAGYAIIGMDTLYIDYDDNQVNAKLSFRLYLQPNSEKEPIGIKIIPYNVECESKVSGLKANLCRSVFYHGSLESRISSTIVEIFLKSIGSVFTEKDWQVLSNKIDGVVISDINNSPKKIHFPSGVFRPNFRIIQLGFMEDNFFIVFSSN